MTKLHEMAGLVDLTLEPAEGLLDALALTDLDLDGNGKGGGRGSGGCCNMRDRKSNGTNVCEIYDTDMWKVEMQRWAWETAGIWT